MAGRKPVVIGALLAIVALALGACQITVGSYTKRHCDAFEEA